MKLVIGNKNYSSWSLRPWLLLKHFGLPFTEVQVSLAHDDLKSVLVKYSPSCKVPVLLDDDLTIWDSLAICEYVSEHYLSGAGWPADKTQRAMARSLSSEMHAGFMALRSELPMNCRANRIVNLTHSVNYDVSRIDAMWSQATQRHAETGPWLFGDFSIADCFFALWRSGLLPITCR